MPNYILLMTLTREGQEAVLRDADFIVEAASETHVQDVQGLGLYGRPRTLRLRQHHRGA